MIIKTALKEACGIKEMRQRSRIVGIGGEYMAFILEIRYQHCRGSV